MGNQRHAHGVTGYRYSMCRLMGHAWLIVPSDWQVPAGVQPMTARCERCDIERRDQLSRYSGELHSRKYTYPDGYLFSKDTDEEELPTRIDFRMSWIEAEINKQRDIRNEMLAAQRVEQRRQGRPGHEHENRASHPSNPTRSSDPS